MLGVTIIGGYLGAGKTTLVNHLLRHAGGIKIAVLVNEFGSLPIDEDLIEASEDGLISIAGGCICCSYGNDLIKALGDLANLEAAPDHVLIEASGVALPGAIAASVGVMNGLMVEGVVVLVDAETVRTQADDVYVGDTITRQLADADLVLVNKTDLVTETVRDGLRSWLSRQAPQSAVVFAKDARVPSSVVMQNLSTDRNWEGQANLVHDPSFETQIVQIKPDVDPETVAQELARPSLGVIRAKGFVQTSLGMKTIQLVGRRWAVSDAPSGVQAGVVVIAHRHSGALAQVSKLDFVDKP